MGQQQQILLSGGMFIVFITLAMGLRLYEENNDAMYLTQIEQELGYLAMKSQEYYHKPLHLNGGNGTFSGVATADDLTAILGGSPRTEAGDHTYTLSFSLITSATDDSMTISAEGSTPLRDRTFPRYELSVTGGNFSLRRAR